MSLAVLCAAYTPFLLEAQTNRAQQPISAQATPLQVNGIFPSLTSRNDMATSLKMSEIGTGALMPWGDYLYTLDYLRNPGAGSGAGLYRIDKNMQRTLVANHTSCYANRMIHRGTNSIVMGPFKIDASNKVSQFDSLMNVRIGGMAEHLTEPDNQVYFVGMEGQFWEANLVTMKATQLFDLCKELDFCHAGEQQHGKAAFTRNGITYVAFNTFEQADFIQSATEGNPYSGGGRFASWDGKGNWTVLETTAFMEVTGRTTFGGVVYALGWDSASVILKVLQEDGPDPMYSTPGRLRRDRRATTDAVPVSVSGVRDWIDHSHAVCDSKARVQNGSLFHLSHVGIVYSNAVSAIDCCAKCASANDCLTWSFTNAWGDGNCHLSPYRPLNVTKDINSCGGSDPGAPIPPAASMRRWQTYRLPKASHAYDHLWQTEWPRIREVETERYLFDMHGQFYELSPLGWAGSTWGVKPVAQHLRMIPDFCSWNGMLVLGGNQVTPHSGANLYTGQAQTGLWFGKTDDLWSFGKPIGWGGPWRNEKVSAGQASDPYLMTGFDKKVLHLHAKTIDGSPIQSPFLFTIQIDFTGTAGSHKIGEPWHNYTTIDLSKSQNGALINSPTGYAFHAFPTGFSAHWVRVLAHSPSIATAYFHYT